jgi:PKD repeat protein
MPILNLVLSPGTTSSRTSTALVYDLQVELAALGYAVALSDIDLRSFGPSTVEAVKSFRVLFGFPAGDSVDPLLGRLTRLAALAVKGNTAAIRDALQEMGAMADGAPPATQARLARIALSAGDFARAKAAAARAAGSLEARRVALRVSAVERKAARPEAVFPENFYAYRFEPFGSDTDAVLSQLSHQSVASGLSRKPRDDEPPADPNGEWTPLPETPPEDPPPPPVFEPITPPEQRVKVQRAALYAVQAMQAWQWGNAEFRAQRYASAANAYADCQQLARYYFSLKRQLRIRSSLDVIARESIRPPFPDDSVYLREPLNSRRLALDIDEIKALDWTAPAALAAEVMSRELNGEQVKSNPNESNDEAERTRLATALEYCWDRPLFLMVSLFAPLARSEANRMRRQFDEAIKDLRRAMAPTVVNFPSQSRAVTEGSPTPTPVNPVRHVNVTSTVIEEPFLRLMLAETLFEQAEAQYRSRAVVPATPMGEELQARQTYQSVIDLFADDGRYVAIAEQGRLALQQRVGETLAAAAGGDGGALLTDTFMSLGKEIHLSPWQAASGTLPGVGGAPAPHAPLLREVNGADGVAIRESNPRVYALILSAQARLAQIAAGFNYLGYTDAYVPPWRFQFLLERARYFCEHARGAQRDYLNFLSNAESNELQEMSAAQTVALEKANVQTESARIDQVQLEVAAATQSQLLSTLTLTNARQRIQAFREFDSQINELESSSNLINGAIGAGAIVAGVASGGWAIAGAAIIGVASYFGSRNRNDQAGEQRALEQKNLALAVQEAEQSTQLAAANLAVAQTGLLVAGLQRQAALLRHEFATQTLRFLHGRVLNAEQWYRLASGIRSVADSYLRFAIETAFLAEQAYEFESDQQINVIRFDYDQSEVGNFLAGDFLLRDLDTLEHHLVVTQRERQQQVRYVLSMARDCPAALQALRDNGSVTFGMVLEQIEHRFPGLYNARLGAVDMQPVALMDATRFSAALTHLGSGQVRLHPQLAMPLPVMDPAWSADRKALETQWPRTTRVCAPETVIFSGLSRPEAAGTFAFATSAQRNAFEGRPAASAWQLDMSTQDNQVLPGTLADVLITFTLSGYYDGHLRDLVEKTQPRSEVTTQYLSARNTFPDAFYEFNRTGRLTLDVAADLLTLTGTPGRLRNAGLLLLPSPRQPHFGRCHAWHRVDVRIGTDGKLQVLSEIPEVSFEMGAPGNFLQVTAKLKPNGADAQWDFGDGSTRVIGSTGQHTYGKPGTYVITLRLVRDGRLTEFKASVSVSRSQKLAPPVTAFPVLTKQPGLTPPLIAKVRASTSDGKVAASWQLVGKVSATGDSVDFGNLPAGDYSLLCRVSRELTVRVYGQQQYKPETKLQMPTTALTSNRKFDTNTGADTTGASANTFSKHLFTTPFGALSPSDRWTLEVLPADNPFLNTVSDTDQTQLDLSSYGDVVWTMEYEVNL